MLTHVNSVKSHFEAKNYLADREWAIADYHQNFLPKLISELEQQIPKDREDFQREKARLEADIARGAHPSVIKPQRTLVELVEGILKNDIARLKEAKYFLENKVQPDGVGYSKLEMASFTLAWAGMRVDSSGLSRSEFVKAIEAGVENLGDSYGGYLGVNVYGGFTQKQLEALRAFKAKYAPQVKIALLPVDDMTFSPLSETFKDPITNKQKSATIFRQINGSGDYLGATIIMDTTVTGAGAFANHLSPFILPVAIKTTLKRRASMTSAKLDCDFSNGFSIKAHNQIRPEFLVFGREVISDFKSTDINGGGCKLKMIGGDSSTAEHKAMAELEKALTDMQVARTTLSKNEKEAYAKKIVEDAQKNPQKNNGLYRWVRAYTGWGWGGLLVEALAGSQDSFWQVSQHNVQNLSKVKFSRHVVVEPDEIVTKSLPVDLCLVYDNDKKAYDRCTEAEEQTAQGLAQAVSMVQSSPECGRNVDPFSCGENRDKAGLTASTARTWVPSHDAHQPPAAF